MCEKFTTFFSGGTGYCYKTLNDSVLSCSRFLIFRLSQTSSRTSTDACVTKSRTADFCYHYIIFGVDCERNGKRNEFPRKSHRKHFICTSCCCNTLYRYSETETVYMQHNKNQGEMQKQTYSVWTNVCVCVFMYVKPFK